MAYELAQLLITIGFVMLGSAVFHISALISGYSIYKEMQTVESTFLSTAVGLVIFLFTPISLVILGISRGIDIISWILNPNVIGAFLLCSVGLGLIFGHLAMLDARVVLLSWLREISGIPFWISFHGFLWDDLLTSVKKNGEISIEKKEDFCSNLSEGIRCKLIAASSKDEKREIEVETIDSGDRYLIPLEKMGYIKIPEKSFKKHEEKINHIGQAFCCMMVAMGFFFLAYSGTLSSKFSNTSELTTALNSSNISLTSLPGSYIPEFYEYMKYIFIICSIILLPICVWIARKDFANWDSYFRFCPDFWFFSFWLSVIFLQLVFPINFYDINVALLITAAFIFVLVFLIGSTESTYSYITNSDNSDYYLLISGIIYLYLSFFIDRLLFFKERFADKQVMFNIDGIWIFIALLLILIIYLSLIRSLIKNPIKNEFEKIIANVKKIVQNENPKMKEPAICDIVGGIVRKMYSEICFDDIEKSDFSYLEKKLDDKYNIKNILSEEEKKVFKPLIENLRELENKDYLKHEAGTILFAFQGFIKNKRKR